MRCEWCWGENIFKWRGSKSNKANKPQRTATGDRCNDGGDGGSPGLTPHEYPSSPGLTSLHHTHTPASPITPRNTKPQENQDETRRTENTLKIGIMEAKGIPSKRKYFCRLTLNSELYGRTCSKQKTDLCFWGEYFELNLLPQVTSMMVELMREGEKRGGGGCKRVGWVEISLKPTPSSRPCLAMEERWYQVQVDKPEKDAPALRIKHKFQSLDILPLEKYGRLRAYLRERGPSLCQLLEPVVCVRMKEDVATALVHITQAENRAAPFLADLVCADVHKIAENEHLLFRANSIATKAVESYMKLVGEQFLHTTLREAVQEMTGPGGRDLEVDPLRVANIQQLPAQRAALREQVTTIWDRIVSAGCNFPVELREMFQTLRKRLSHEEKCELTDNLISSCVFLRFLVPAILSPSLFNITKEFPDERSSRNLTLVAKTLQTLANFTHFQGKEGFMEFLNDFINREQPRCRSFLRDISSAAGEGDSTLEFDGKIDLGKHLALLHIYLADALVKMDTQGCESDASQVLALVGDISVQLEGDGLPTGSPLLTSTPSHNIPNPNLTPSTPSHNNNNNNNNSNNNNNNNNNNYRREECVNAPGEGGRAMVGGLSPLPTDTPAHRSHSLPRAVPPVHHLHHLKTSGSPGLNQLPGRERLAGPDLGVGMGVGGEEMVLTTAYDHHSTAPPHITMHPSIEANNNILHNMNNNNNNNNNLGIAADARLSNGNTYYLADVDVPSPPPPHGYSIRTPQHIPSRLCTRPVVSPRSMAVADRRVGGVYQEKCSELYNFMDLCSNKVRDLCLKDLHDANLQGSNLQSDPNHDDTNMMQGSQTSISQLSNMASSSGYQSFAYSQSSSSPVDSLLLLHHTDNTTGNFVSSSRENGNSLGNSRGGGMRQVLQGSPLASPLHQMAKQHRPLHPSPLGHIPGHPSSLQGTPRRASRLSQGKGSPNGSLSSCQSAEELRCLRRSRPRHRRRSHSSDTSDPSSDTSPDTRPSHHAPSSSPRPLNYAPSYHRPHCHSPDTSPDNNALSRPSYHQQHHQHPRLPSDTSPDTRLHSIYTRHPPPPRTNPHCSPRLSASPALRQEVRQATRVRHHSGSGKRVKTQRRSEQEEFSRAAGGGGGGGGDSEEDMSVGVVGGSPGGAGRQEGGGRTYHIPPHLLPPGLSPHHLLDQQEDQMRVIIERLMSMEHDFRLEQEVLRRAVEDKEARITAQARHIAALDSANTQLIRTIASLSSRPGTELKTDTTGELHTDSCNASDTSDYKSSSC
ncbi:hypothetical protein Pmani_013488 [Petrolisthes manimaculis]|uniref:Ras GTPase-activating protein n=1 Tax=Petrolisthes manimaculis TaxID=1843537 RepID=A0AAE1U9K9_9EUCA|nr:hypothetical protein Pmani_013488 [Petrolisthes manimaculis]